MMKRYLITGATGYIGSMLIRYLLKQEVSGIKITAIVRNFQKASGMLPSEVELLQADLCDICAMEKIRGQFTHIIHCASVTKSSEMREHPVEVIQSIINTTQSIMELARRCKAQSVVMLSSMEVYGQIDCGKNQRVREEDAEKGFIEITNVRSCYPLAKRMAENIGYSYWKEYAVPVKIARLAQTFGKGILSSENRVFAQFSCAAIKGEDIVLHTKGESMGNYCDIEDTIEGILLLLEKGENGEAYNIVNEENTMTIRQVAELVANKIADGKIRIRYEIPQENTYGYAADTGLRLSSKKIEKLGWQPHKNLEQMYRDVLVAMKAE